MELLVLIEEVAIARSRRALIPNEFAMIPGRLSESIIRTEEVLKSDPNAMGLLRMLQDKGRVSNSRIPNDYGPAVRDLVAAELCRVQFFRDDAYVFPTRYGLSLAARYERERF